MQDNNAVPLTWKPNCEFQPDLSSEAGVCGLPMIRECYYYSVCAAYCADCVLD